MAFEDGVRYLSTLVAGADLSGSQFRLVKLDTTAGQVVAAAAATDRAIGVLQNKPKAGERALIADIDAGGIAKVEVGASQTVNVGSLLTSNASGQAVVAAAGNQVFGIALEPATTGAGAKAVISVKFLRTTA